MQGSDPSGSRPHTRTTTDAPSALGRYLPIVDWLPRYQRAWLRADALAGLTLWGLVVPEGMAYAGIAGLPPQAGLYTLVASLLVYALLGTARHLSVQATSATAALLATSVAAAVAASGAASDAKTYVMDQLPPTPGTPRASFTPAAVTPPAWWAEARIPLDEAGTVGS